MKNSGSPRCRSCDAALRYTFVDLGMSPLANSYIDADQHSRCERYYPLHAYVCHRCFLVQLESMTSPKEIFSDYAYFSSYSDSWLDHARAYAEKAITMFALHPTTLVVEVASNDGYLLQYFAARGIPVVGIEPARNVAQAAIERGVPTEIRFFTAAYAQELAAAVGQADLIVANNVLAHVPDLNDFVRGLQISLKQDGVTTVEFPHLMHLMQENQFDTIYHEHFSYFSLIAAQKVFQRQSLRIFDVEELPTHGGSLRLYACREGSRSRPIGHRVDDLIMRERETGMLNLQTYLSFGARVKNSKKKLVDFLVAAKRNNKTVAAYGAPAKGNTLLNYCGVCTDLIDYTVDRSPHKQGRLLPGTRIPIFAPDHIRQTTPDYLLILPWNLKTEIMEQMSYIRCWGGQFIVPIPEVQIC
jgi:2-polyprenyl-3-methyl-5-hydroxy-6-metoxy-1,4-benzoquinol methylase